MIYGVILAGGVGTRMGSEKPKQFLNIGGKPVIIHTIEKFCLYSNFKRILVLTPKKWIGYTKDLIKKYIGEAPVEVIEGGQVRNETLMNAIRYIEEKDGIDKDTIIVTHDAVRPFVTYRMIEENVEAAEKYGACDTVVPATDTIIASDDGETISSVPERKKLYQGQTPQSFKAQRLKEIYESLSQEEKDSLTDAAKIFVLGGEKVKLVKGETYNVKITYPYDIAVAEALLKGDIKC